MRTLLYLLLPIATVLLSCEVPVGHQVDETEKPPNIIWFVAEDLSPRFSFYGDTLALTPALDQLAGKGMVFQNAFTVSGVCAPSRSSMITGCYPSSIGTQHMRQSKSVIPMPGVPNYNAVPPPDIKAFPEILRSHGYWTASYSKMDYQLGAPFTVWDTISQRPHWRQRKHKDKNRPFFIYNTFEITHEINIWPDSTKQQFFKEKNIDPRKLAKDVQVRPPLDSMGRTIGLEDVQVPPYLPDNFITRSHLVRHYYNIMRMDQQIAKILADLKADGLEEDTILFFMSDHGDCLPRGKRWLYDSGTRSPLVVYIPPKYLPKGFKQPGRDSNLYSFVDLPPTVLELAGIEIPQWIQGKSIVSELLENPREYVYGSRDRMDNRYDTRRSVRSSDYLYIKNFSPEKPYQQQIEFLETMPLMKNILELKKQNKLNAVQAAWLDEAKPAEELYYLKEDPHEIHNLSDDPNYDNVRKELEGELLKWMTEINDLYALDEKEQAERAWPGGRQPLTEAVRFDLRDNHLVLSSETKGASIAYRSYPDQRWEIYSEPIIYEGKKIEAKAVRYGYQESKPTSYEHSE